MQDKNRSLDAINKRLEVIIYLLLQQTITRGKKSDEPSMREQIRILDSVDLEPKEIAKILNRTSGYINKELFVLKKEKKNG